MDNLLISEKIELRPASIEDKRNVFDWLTRSNLTKEMLGEPNYPDADIPTWNEFDNDYLDHYFNDSAPLEGRSFIIIEKGCEVGHINYNPIDSLQKTTDLDIWLRDIKYTGRGIGTEAIKLLSDYLYKTFGCEQIMIAPSKRNKNAIKSYKKAGFIITDVELDESEKDYDDTVVLIKSMKK